MDKSGPQRSGTSALVPIDNQDKIDRHITCIDNKIEEYNNILALLFLQLFDFIRLQKLQYNKGNFLERHTLALHRDTFGAEIKKRDRYDKRNQEVEFANKGYRCESSKKQK